MVSEERHMLAQERLTTLFKESKRKFQPDGMYFMGGSLQYYTTCAARNFENELSAALARITNPKTHVCPKEWRRFEQKVYHYLPEFFKQLPDITPVSFDEWNSHFSQSRRKVNAKTWAEMTDKNGKFKAIDKRTAQKWLRQSPMIKQDKDDHNSGKSPRLVLAQSNYVAITMGMVIASINRSIEKMLKINADSNIIFACGLTPTELSESFQKAKDGDYDYIDNDYSQYDATQHFGFGRILERVYGYIFDKNSMSGFDPILLSNFTLIRSLIHTTTNARLRYGLYMRCTGQMKSGQADTCLGNTLNNIFAHLYAFSVAGKVTMRTVERNIIMHVLGDDNSTAVRRTGWSKGLNLQTITETMEKLGLMPKLEWKEFDEVKFLNLIPLPVQRRIAPSQLAGKTYVKTIQMSLMAGRIAHRILSTTKRPECVPAHCIGLSKCLGSICSHDPMGSAIASSIAMRFGGHPDPNQVKGRVHRSQELKKQVTSRFGYYLDELLRTRRISLLQNSDKPTTATYQFYAKRYGMSVLDVHRSISHLKENSAYYHTDKYIDELIFVDRAAAAA